MSTRSRAPKNGSGSAASVETSTVGDDRGASHVQEMEPATYLLDAMARMHHAVFQIGTDRLRPWGITLSSYAALRALDRRPDLTLGQLARRCFVKPQTMTRMVS